MPSSCVSGESTRGKPIQTFNTRLYYLRVQWLTYLFLSCRLAEDKTVGSNGFEKVKLVPDGSALFTRGMGMSATWEQERGFGERSWRYSAVINDMKVEKLFIEGGEVIQDFGPDPFGVSDAGTMLNYLKSSSK